MLEGETSEPARPDRLPDDPGPPARPAHAEARPSPSYEIDFRPGNFAWGPGQPRPQGPRRGSTRSRSACSAARRARGRRADHSPAIRSSSSSSRTCRRRCPPVAHVADPQGRPDGQDPPAVQGPRMPQAAGRLRGPATAGSSPISGSIASSRAEGPAQFAFLYVDRPELVEDFLNPPKDAGEPTGSRGSAIATRPARPGRTTGVLDGQAGKSVTLPDSDLTVTFAGRGRASRSPRPGSGGRWASRRSRSPQFKVRQGGGPEVDHYGWASLPMFPNVIPSQAGPKARRTRRPSWRSTTICPPRSTPRPNGRFGVVEVLGTPDGSLYYRVFGRGEQGRSEVRPAGPVKNGKEIVAFGGNPNMPMTIIVRGRGLPPGGASRRRSASRSCSPRARWATASRPAWSR